MEGRCVSHDHQPHSTSRVAAAPPATATSHIAICLREPAPESNARHAPATCNVPPSYSQESPQVPGLAQMKRRDATLTPYTWCISSATKPDPLLTPRRSPPPQRAQGKGRIICKPSGCRWRSRCRWPQWSIRNTIYSCWRPLDPTNPPTSLSLSLTRTPTMASTRRALFWLLAVFTALSAAGSSLSSPSPSSPCGAPALLRVLSKLTLFV